MPHTGSGWKNQDIKLNIESVDIKHIISSVTNIFRYICSNTDVEIACRVPDDIPCVLADSNRFQQIMYNLMDNAVKFTQKGHIFICVEAGGNYVKITIEDTGEGIPWDRIDDIWKSLLNYRNTMQTTRII